MDSQEINRIWKDALYYNSYTVMGARINFDAMTDAYFGHRNWNMRNKALSEMSNASLSDEEKIKILKAGGAIKVIIKETLKTEKGFNKGSSLPITTSNPPMPKVKPPKKK